MTSKEKSPYLNKKDSINLQPHPFSKKGKSEIKENIKALIIGSGSLTNIEACLQKSDIAWKAANTKAEILQELNGQNVDVALFCTESSAVKISQVLNFLGRQPKYIPIILLSSEAKAKYVPLLNQGVFQIVSGQQIEFLPQFFLAAYNQALFEQQKKRQLELVQLQNNLIHDLEKNKALANSIQVFLSGVQQQLELPCTSFLFNSQEDSKEAYKAISVANCSNNTDQNLLSGQLISSLDHKQIKELQYGIPISLEASQLTELTEDKFGGLRGIKQLLLFPVNLDRRLLGLFAIALHKEDSIIWENETFSFFNTATLNLRNFFRAQSAKQSVLGYEEKLRQLFLLGSGLVVVANKEGIVTFASENHFSILGFRASKIVGRHLIELVHPDDIPLVRESFNQIKSNQRKTIPSIRVSSRKGPHRWMKVTLTNQLLNPSVKGVIINSTDITEIIEKERELELSELRFKLAANASADITFDWDLLEDKIYRDGSFGHSHKNAWRFKDFSSPESWEQHVHPADKDKIYALLKKALNDPKKTFCEAEYRMIDNHNHVIYVHDKGFILRDEDGKPIRLVGATTETTRQKVNELHSELIKSLQSFFSDEKNLTTSTRLLLKKFCELGDFSAAEFWIANPKKTSAQLLSTIAITDSGKKFLNQSTTSKFKTGHGFPGAAIEQDNILSEDLLAPEQQFNRQQMARNCGLKSAHCLPLYHLGDHIGSILLFSTHTASNNQFFIQVLDQFRSILSPELKRKIATEEIKTVFEASPVLIFRLNLEGKVLQCNRKAENLFGSNFTNCNFSDIIYPQDRHLWEKRIENKSKQIVSIELRIRGKFNQLIWLRMNVAVNAEEEILSIFAIDLTSEIELRNLLKEAQGLAKLSPFIYSLPNQRFHFPESLGKVLKLNADKNLRLDKFCSIIQDKLLANKLRKALSSPGIKTISVSEEIPITTNGKLRWIKFKAQHDPKVFTEEQLLGSIQDITELKEIQQELTRTNLRLNLAVNSRKMGIWDWDIQSDVLLWDDNMLEIFGVGREKFTEDFKVWQDAVHPDDVLPATQEVEKAIKGEKEFNTEFRIIREGKIRWIKAHGTVLRDQELNPTRMVGLNYDITEEKNKAIEQQEAHLKTEGILRSITDGFISMDEEFRINYWNAAAEKILGMERTKVLGKTIQSVFKEFEGSKTHKEFHLAQTKQELREFEAYYPNIGSWAMVSVYPKASGITVYFKDITKERKKIKELQQLKNLQNHVINSTQDLIWAIDCDYNLELFNNGYSQFCEQVLNFKPILKLKVPSLNSKLNWPDGYQEKMLSAYKLALSGCAHQIKIKVITGENERILSIHFYPIHSQKNTKAAILGVACFGEDVTVMENWQQAIEKQNNQLRDIAWTQSHLVRAPLAKIMGLVQLLQVELKDYNDVKQHLDFLDKSCSELDETIRSITQYTHPIKHPSK